LGKIRERNRKQEKYLKKRRESSDWNLMKVNGNNVIKKKRRKLKIMQEILLNH
jgi:hypothetical protein